MQELTVRNLLDRERSNESEAGFSLVELLVVIIILGVLASIALPSFLGQRTKGYDAAAKSDSRALASAIVGAETDDISPAAFTFAIAASTGWHGTSGVNHAFCPMDDSSFAVASKHTNSDNILIVDLQGRLVEVAAADLTSALEGVVGGPCDNPIVTD